MSYTEQFFESQQQGSMASAEVIVPIITSLFPVRSVIDVGCGVGGWLKTFGKHGVTDHLGIDGDYVIEPAEDFTETLRANGPDKAVQDRPDVRLGMLAGSSRAFAKAFR